MRLSTSCGLHRDTEHLDLVIYVNLDISGTQGCHGAFNETFLINCFLHNADSVTTVGPSANETQ